MESIVQKKGQLSQEDTSFITNMDAKRYLESLKIDLVAQARYTVDMQEEMPDLQELVKIMTEFNPYNRAVASECLKSKFFDKVRVKELEKDAPCRIFLEIDSDDFCDYETGTNKKYTQEMLLKIIFDEVQQTKKERL